jgi:hypothetical protein
MGFPRLVLTLPRIRARFEYRIVCRRTVRRPRRNPSASFALGPAREPLGLGGPAMLRSGS